MLFYQIFTRFSGDIKSRYLERHSATWKSLNQVIRKEALLKQIWWHEVEEAKTFQLSSQSVCKRENNWKVIIAIHRLVSTFDEYKWDFCVLTLKEWRRQGMFEQEFNYIERVWLHFPSLVSPFSLFYWFSCSRKKFLSFFSCSSRGKHKSQIVLEKCVFTTEA